MVRFLCISKAKKNNGISVNQTKDEFSFDESKSMRLPLIAVFYGFITQMRERQSGNVTKSAIWKLCDHIGSLFLARQTKPRNPKTLTSVFRSLIVTIFIFSLDFWPEFVFGVADYLFKTIRPFPSDLKTNFKERLSARNWYKCDFSYLWK